MAIRYLVPDGKHLPVSGEDGKADHRLMGAAWAALHGGYRGSKYEGPGKEKALAKLKALYKSEGMETPAESQLASDGVLHFTITLSDALPDGASRQAIAVTGHWVKRSGQHIDITTAMLNEMVSNFAKDPIGVNVDYDHASESPLLGLLGPSPSAGRLVKLDPVESLADSGRSVLYGYYEPTAKARELASPGPNGEPAEYRYFSINVDKILDKKTGEAQGWTITSVALTNNPVMRELPAIQLSDNEGAFMDAGSVHAPSNISDPARGGQSKGGNMAFPKATLKCAADGTHEVHGPDGQLATIEEKHLKQYAKEHLGMDDAKELSDKSRIAVLGQIGATGKTIAEVKALIDRGAAPIKTEAQMLSETIIADGAVDRAKLLQFVRNGELKADAPFVMSDAQARVQKAFEKGLLTAAQVKTGSPLRLALSDDAAFKALIEERPPVVPVNKVVSLPAGPSDKSPLEIAEMQLSDAITAQMKAAGQTHDQAEHFVVSTPEGRELWNTARRLRLEANAEKD
jgi:hypothetical protein